MHKLALPWLTSLSYLATQVSATNKQGKSDKARSIWGKLAISFEVRLSWDFSRPSAS